MADKICIKKSKIQGNGIFASRNIGKEEIILSVKGPTIKYLNEINPRLGPHWLNVGKNLWQMPLAKEYWRYINHSCNPNSTLTHKHEVIAIKPILTGEEILIDYSITETGQNYKLNCKCNSKNCRKIIKSIQYLPHKIYLKYEKYLPEFQKKEFLKEKTYTTKINGRSNLFAKRNLFKGEKLFDVEGPIVSYTFPPNYRLGPNWLNISKNKWIIPFKNSPWNYLNHSCNPNVGLIERNTLVAMRKIKQNEELTIDNSITESDPRWKQKCSCKSKNCRGVIRSIQYLPHKIYKKYLPFIPPYMQKVYKD